MTLRFLIDAQLPPKLAATLRDVGYEVSHVAEIGMLASSDKSIWNQAGKLNAALVTKDRDFLTIRAAAETGPTVVWVRAGNVGNRQLIASFVRALPAVVAAIERREAVVEIVAPCRP
ncbi:MAG: DUF5615 family PIN-like protein [Rhodopseudomonas sp.]|uniref:DUF5615 family PIN-like protein n=1 Tax=Rhodopseudomonas sp. TaxID=1078 RepID=UPI0039E62E23